MRTAGRPRGLQFSVFIGVKLTPADAEKLRRLVAQAGTDQSTVVRSLLRAATLEDDGAPAPEAEALSVDS